jgi:hypothetical protein
MIEPDLQYSVLCDEVRREDNGKLMFLGLFEHIGSVGFPMQHPRLCVANKWCNGMGKWTQQTRLVDENDTVVAQNPPIEFEIASLEDHFTAIQMFNSIVFPAPGRVWVEVLLNDDLKLRYGLRILSIQQPQAPNQ